MADYKGSTRYVKMQPKKLKKNAKKAINKDDARGYRKRVVKAKRIKGETTVKPQGMARNPDDLGKLIADQQRKKPY